MHISTKCRHALTALLDLALHAEARVVKVSEIAVRRRVPLRCLTNAMIPLRQAGLVESRRGVDGGYRLARPANRIGVGEVVRLIDGPLEPADTADATGGETDAALENLWKRAGQALARVLDGTTIADLAADQRKSEAMLAASWSI